ncbi:MAG: acyl-CoA dehydrogenase, partial [Desulfobacca sp.]|nr:acyl-CoA dehydrogenase [Desulfobacca sp.]
MLRLEVCVKCQVVAEECLKEALPYAKVREAFGQTYLNPLVAETIRGDDIVTKIFMAKAWLGEMVNRVAYQAVQLHGGYGYLEEYRISRLFRDARRLSIFAGTTEIMK